MIDYKQKVLEKYPNASIGLPPKRKGREGYLYLYESKESADKRNPFRIIGEGKTEEDAWEYAWIWDVDLKFEDLGL